MRVSPFLPLFLAFLPLQVVSAQAPQPPRATVPQVTSNRIVLTLTSDRVPSLNGQVLAWDRLDAEFGAIYTDRPKRDLYLMAHPNNDYRAVARVVEMAKRMGITVHFVPYEKT